MGQFSMVLHALVLLLVASLSWGAEPPPERGLGLPGWNRGLHLDLTHYEVERHEVREDGLARQVVYKHRDRRSLITVTLKPAEAEGGATAYRDHHWAELASGPPDKKDVERWESGGVAWLRYETTIPVQGRELPSRHVHGYLERDGVWVTTHVSATPYEEDLAARLDAHIASVALKPTEGSPFVDPSGAFQVWLSPAWTFEGVDPQVGAATLRHQSVFGAVYFNPGRFPIGKRIEALEAGQELAGIGSRELVSRERFEVDDRTGHVSRYEGANGSPSIIADVALGDGAVTFVGMALGPGADSAVRRLLESAGAP